MELNNSANKNGTLHIDNVNTVALAKKYGTPLYIYDEERIIDNYNRLKAAFKKRRNNFRLFYAIKANNNLNILKILKNQGSGADASGPAEIELALKAGFPPNKILFTGNYPSDEDLAFAYKKGVIINLDDISLLPSLLKNGTPEFLSFRINPGIGKGKFKGLIFAGPDAKFGVPEKEVINAYRAAQKAGIKRFGIHMMTGSAVLDPNYFKAITEKMLDIIEKVVTTLNIQFDFVDIGGSLGIPYEPTDKPLDINKVAELVTKTIEARQQQLNLTNADLVMEPGRYLVGDAGILLTTVTAIKNAEKTFIGTDAGMNTLLRPALYGAYHKIVIANDLNRNGKQKVDITGQICENTDRLAKDRIMPNIERNDLLAVLDTGAYGFSMGSQYNSRPMAAEVLISNGKPRLIRKRETNSDISRNVIT